MEKAVVYSAEGNLAVLTLNRPERKNAINGELLKLLYDYIEKASEDSAVSAIIITGMGDSFCSGIDLDCLKTDNLFDPRGDGKNMVEIFSECKKTVIGAVNGYAITGGFEIALNCDFLIASENAVFADTHARVGIHPGWGMTQLLQQAVGQRMAKQFSLTCEKIYPDKALACGLVNEVVSQEKLLTRAREIGNSISKANPSMILTIKDLIESRNSMTLNASLENENCGFKKFISSF